MCGENSSRNEGNPLLASLAKEDRYTNSVNNVPNYVFEPKNLATTTSTPCANRICSYSCTVPVSKSRVFSCLDKCGIELRPSQVVVKELGDAVPKD